MSCLLRRLRGKEKAFEDKKNWNKILGLRQECNLPCCQGTKIGNHCTFREYYEQLEVSGVVVACCFRGDGHILNVTKKINGVEIVEHRREPLPNGIRD